MTGRRRPYLLRQDGFTLVELVIALAIGVIVMTALTSVVLTATRGAAIASSQVEASSQLRTFDSFVTDDVALSGIPATSSCGTSATPCTTQALVLSGTSVSNSTNPLPAAYSVSYAWDGTSFVDRTVGGTSVHAATDVTSFAWYVDTSGAFPTVVVAMTVTVGGYSQSQTFQFVPRLNP